MHYEIYPDMLLLENFFCNLICLGAAKRWICTVSWKRCIGAAFFAALVNTGFSILLFRHFWILQLGVLFPVTGVMVCACLRIREWRKSFLLICRFAWLGLMLGGVLEYLGQWEGLRMKILLSALLVLSASAIIPVFRIYSRKSEAMRDVCICFNQKCREIRGLADTGNMLTDPISKKPVCILEYEELKLILTTRQQYEIAELLDFGFPKDCETTGYYLIPYQSLGSPSGLLVAMELDRMIIYCGKCRKVVEKPLVGITRQQFAGIFHYSILLHNDYC